MRSPSSATESLVDMRDIPESPYPPPPISPFPPRYLPFRTSRLFCNDMSRESKLNPPSSIRPLQFARLYSSLVW